MKKFEFRMQKLLDIREKLELEQKNKLAKVAAEYQQVLQKQEQAQHKSQDFRYKVYEDMKNGEISIQNLCYMDQLDLKAKQYIRSLVPQLEEKRQTMEKEKEKYMKLHKDKKLLENLKKKELQKYKQTQARSESMIMDEIAKNFTHDMSNYYE